MVEPRVDYGDQTKRKPSDPILVLCPLLGWPILVERFVIRRQQPMQIIVVQLS